MKALRKHQQGLRFEDLPCPELQADDEVLVDVRVAGICRTDLSVADGLIPVTSPLVLGHEFAGTLRKTGAKVFTPIGSRVAVRPWVDCGACTACRSRQTCTRKRMLGMDMDGAFAEVVKVPASCIVPLPEDVTFERGALLEPVAAALAPLRERLEGKVAILGRNRIGALVARVLEAHGIRATTLNLESGGAHLEEGDASFDVVIESMATEASLNRAMGLLRQGGLLILKSRPADTVPLNVTMAVLNDLRIHAVNYGSFEEAAQLLRTLAVEDLLAPPYRLSDYDAAFQEARTGTRKVMFRIGED